MTTRSQARRSAWVWLLAVLLNGPVWAQTPTYLWLDASLNLNPRGEILVVIDPADGRLLAETAQLQRWGILYQRSSLVRNIEEVAFSLLDSIDGLQYQLKHEQSQLQLNMNPALLPVHYIANTAPAPARVRRGRGFHLNYDGLLQHSEGENQLGVLLQPSGYGRWGFVRSSHRLRYDSISQRYDSLRLESQFGHDWINQRLRLTAGDIISASDSFGGRYRLGGIQLQREFSIRPQERSFSSPTISGMASLPSDVELFINGVRRGGFSTPPGPFELRNPPVLTGAGTAELVITDALGEQSVQTLNFYVDPQILRQGLLDFDLAAGLQRQDFGLASDHYRDFSAHGQARYGLTQWLTLQARAMHGPKLSNLELGGLFQLFDWPLTLQLGVGSWRLANHDDGLLGRVAVDFRYHHWFAGLQGLFSQPADGALEPPLQSQLLARAGRRWGRWQIQLNSLYRKRNMDDRFSRQNLRLSRSWQWAGGHWSWSAGAFRSKDSLGERDFGALMSLRFSPDRKQSLALSSGPDNRISAQYRHHSHDELGHRFDAQYLHQDDFSMRSLQWQQKQKATQWRAGWQGYEQQDVLNLGLSGALGRIRSDNGGRWFFARQLGDAYAVADLHGQADVPVYLNNRVITRSDTRGLAVVPRLSPYEINRMSVNPLDLPLNVQIEQTEFELIPGYGSALHVPLSLDSGRAVQFRLMLNPATVVPEGAVIKPAGTQERYYVGRDGQSYVAGLRQNQTDFQVYWRQQQCHFSIALNRLADELMPHLGAIKCE